MSFYSYDQYRGRRGNYQGGRGRERPDRDDSRGQREGDKFDQNRKRQHYDGEAGTSNRGKFQKRGAGCGRGRGGNARKPREEFPSSIETRPENCNDKRGGADSDERVMVVTNFFEVTPRKIIDNAANIVNVTMCHVKFEPEIRNKKESSRLMAQHKNELGSYVYDDSASIYLTKPMKLDQSIKLESESRDGRRYRIIITPKKAVLPKDSMFLTVLNLMIRQAMSMLSLQQVGRNFYDASQAEFIGACRIAIWPGYVTSIRQHENSLLLCCDLSHKLMRQETIYNILQDCHKEGGMFKVSFSKRVLGMTVLTGYNNKTYKITDIDWNQNPLSTFEMNGIKKSYKDYYQERYQIQIRDERQPMLCHKPSAKEIRGGASKLIYLIPELCRATGLDDRMRSDFRQMREIADRIRKSPSERANILRNFNRKLLENEKSAKIFNENELTLSKDLVEFEARRMKQNIIEFGNGQLVDLESDTELRNQVDWSKCLIDKKLYDPRNIKRWAFIFPAKKNCDRSIDIFLDRLIRIGKAMGMEIDRKNCTLEPVYEESRNEYIRKLENCLRRDYGFIMVIVSSMNPSLYSAIKITTLCNQDRLKSVPLQVINHKTIHHKSIDSVLQKIVIQINCKLGGIPWYVHLPTKSIMIIGFDVSHDTKDKKKSYGALVAHYFQKESPKVNDPGRFFSIVDHHERGQDISTRFGTNVITAVNCHIRDHGFPPERIVIYRDGVGDGDIERVMSQEVREIESKLLKIYKQYSMNLQFGFIIINKKINTRIFKKPLSSRDDFVNPLPGTVIDDVITLPERYDFYLISQNVTQGTVTPTSYNIVHDTLNMNPRFIQMLTYRLCHMYYNWSGTTRVPSVVQYAKKLAFLTAQFLQRIPDNCTFEKDEFLYFL